MKLRLRGPFSRLVFSHFWKVWNASEKRRVLVMSKLKRPVKQTKLAIWKGGTGGGPPHYFAIDRMQEMNHESDYAARPFLDDA